MAKMNPAVPVVVGLLAILILFGLVGAALYKEPVVMAHHIETGDHVTVSCVTYYEDGTVAIEASEPFSFVVGEGSIITGIEENVIGMTGGETKRFTVPPEKAFGVVSEQLIGTIDAESAMLLFGGLPEVGTETTVGVVTDVTENGVTIDANHPLAGKTVLIDITIINDGGEGSGH